MDSHAGFLLDSAMHALYDAACLNARMYVPIICAGRELGIRAGRQQNYAARQVCSGAHQGWETPGQGASVAAKKQHARSKLGIGGCCQAACLVAW